MSRYIQQRNVEQITDWIQKSTDVEALQYVAQETIIRLRELHQNKKADQYQTSYQSILSGHKTATPSTPPQTFKTGFDFGSGVFLAFFLGMISVCALIYLALAIFPEQINKLLGF